MVSVYADPVRLERLRALYAIEEQFILQNDRPPTIPELLELHYDSVR